MVFRLSQAALGLAMVYSIFLPLQLGTVWFYIGLPMALAGLVTATIAQVNWSSAPPDKLVTGGLYRYSRHPMYIASLFFFLGVSLATASWVFLVLTFTVNLAALYSSRLEEQDCLEQYGNTYREYMKQTPRWLGLPRKQQVE